MSRFVIRNYGPSRQIAYEQHQICMSNDQCIETDDEEMADVLGREDSIHVTDRGEEASDISPEELAKQKERQVTVDDPEAVYDATHPDDEQQQTDESQQAESNDEVLADSDEIDYSDMTVAELREVAEDREIEIPKGYVKRDELIEALEEYDKEE